MKKEIILKGKSFILRPYKKEDFVSIAKNANNKKIAKNMFEGFPSPYTEKDSKEWVTKIVKKYKKDPVTDFVIDVGGIAVGSIGGSIYESFMLSFGYWLGEKYWSKGIVSEATKLYNKYIFKNFKNIQRIDARVFSWNKGSQRILEKNGFKLEGIARKAYLKNGKIIDTFLFSKLRNE